MSDKATLIDALNAEMLSDIQRMHQKLELCKKDMEHVADTCAGTKQSADSIKDNLDDTVRQFEIMAKGIILFAKDESQKIHIEERENQRKMSDQFMIKLKENTASFKAQLWILFLIGGINFILLIFLLLR